MVLHLRRRRKLLHLTLEEVSPSINRSASMLSLLERQGDVLTLRKLALLAERLQCHPWDLVSWPEFEAPRACPCQAGQEEMP